MKKLLENKSDIIAWLDKYEVKNYTLIPDVQYGFVVDVDGHVDLSTRNLTFIPVKFNVVTGYFDCSNNQLIILEGSPTSVGNSFFCDNNKLQNLEHCPASVGGKFICNKNKIVNLEHFPTSVGVYFCCFDNPSLVDYQHISDFAALKDKVTSDREKALLSQSLHHNKKSLLNKL